jgi:hypothetical protein
VVRNFPGWPADAGEGGLLPETTLQLRGAAGTTAEFAELQLPLAFRAVTT